MIDFSLPPELAALQARAETFVRDVVIPCEGDPREGAHGLDDSLKRELKAKDAGCWRRPSTRSRAASVSTCGRWR